jgi:hypothetical protein
MHMTVHDHLSRRLVRWNQRREHGLNGRFSSMSARPPPPPGLIELFATGKPHPAAVRTSPSPRGALSSDVAALRQFWPCLYCPRPSRQPAVETTPALAWHDPDGARIALPIARSTSRPLLMWQGRPTTGQSERTQCAAGCAHPAHGVRTATPEFGSRARNQPDEPLHGHLLHCYPHWAARDISDSPAMQAPHRPAVTSALQQP